MTPDSSSIPSQATTRILGVGCSMPEKVLSNKDLEKLVETSDEWIVSRTGIRERRILSDHEALTDFTTKASQQAIQNAGLQPDDVDLVIVASYTPERLAPSLSCKTAELLGIPTKPAMDLNAACTGFIYALSVADAMIRTGVYRHVLVIGAEAQSRFVDYTDRNTCILFGDGAAAVVVGPTDDPQRGILSCILGSDSKGSELITLPAKGTLDMNGREVFKFAVVTMGDALDQSLESAGLTNENVDMLIPHQANVRIIDSAAKRLSLPDDRVVRCIDRYGNTGAASIPIALHEAWEKGQLQDGTTLALVGFGAGFTYGSAIVRW